MATCPCGLDTGPERKLLAMHIAAVHGQGATRAFLFAQRLLDGKPLTDDEQAAIRMGRAPEPAPIPPPPTVISKEIPMPDITCHACHRTDGTHASKCPRNRPCVLCAKRATKGLSACVYHQGKTRTNKRVQALNGRIGEGGDSARAAAELLIERLKKIRARLDERIGNVEDLLEIL